ncbi:MAG: SprB repeat-containing protein, partial [Flavobacterium sp.]
MKKNSIWMLFLLFFSLANVQAQVVVTIASGAANVTPNLATSYTSFANLTTALNAITAMSGAVNIQLGGGTEVAPPKGFTIGSTTLNAALTASAGNGGYGGINISGTFVGLNNPSNTNLVGGVGTATAASASPDGILKLVGADYVAINYVSFSDPTSNTTPTTAMEFGVALFKASPTDGCQHNDINSNYFKMQRLNTTVGSGPMIGEAAIIIVNALPTAAITSITITSNSGASTDNVIENNDINGGANGISLYGYIAVSPYDFVDTRNSIFSNYVYNFGGGTPATSSNGIITRGQWETDIEYNNVDNNDGNGVNQNSNLYGINIFNATNSNSITSNNAIKLQSGTTTGGQVYGIYNSINTGGNVPGFSTTINNNTIDMAQPLLTTAGNMRGIYCISSSQILTISNNVISGLSPLAFTGNAYGIYTQGTATTTNITNNSIKNFNRTAATGITYGILSQGTAAATTATTGPTNVIANGNTIDNLTFTATDNTGIIYGINPSTNTITNTINNNIVKNLAVGTSGSIYGIYDNGIAGTKVCQNNQVFNFSTPAGVGSGTNNSYFGIYFTNNAIAAFNVDISGNSIYSLNNSGTGTNGEVYGIYCTALQPSFIYKNKIYDLSYAGTNTSTNGWASGIFALNNVSTIYNNTIADLRMPNYAQPAQKLFGIRVGNANLYYNTVFLNGTNASSAAIFAFTAGTLNLNDNIFINNITPNAGGVASAYSRGDTTLSTYNAASNNNLLAGTNIFYDGTNTDATLAAYKTRMSFRDQTSVTEVTTPFTSTAGSNANFLQLPTNAVSVANNAALPITSPAITTDYFGVTRSSTTPDIGASEFNGLVCTLPVAYAVTGGGTYCAGGSGFTVGVANSETTMFYSLKKDGVATGFGFIGTGAAFSFPNQTVAGAYTIEAKNNNAGCPQTVTTMTGSAIITIDPATVGGSIAGTATKCSNTNSGTLTLSGNTGAVLRWESAVSPFTVWTPIANTTLTNNYSNLNATTQFRAVVQSGSCAVTNSSVATITVSIIATTASQINISCNGGSNGTASVIASGGTAPYTYSWSPSGGTAASASGLNPGAYICTITDNNGCSSTRNFTITQPTLLSGSTVVTNVACNGGTNGVINLTPSGGTAPYTFVWGGGVTTEDRTGLAAGNYSVIITDGNSCTTTVSGIIVTQPSAVSGSAVVTNIACNGGTTGSINLTPSGGTPGYTFNWGGGITTEDRTGLAAGTYSVTITDVNNCTATKSYTVTQPTAISGSTVVTNVACNGAANGAINLTPSGGTPGYTFNWGGGITTEDRTGLVAGTYTVIITDANGCTGTVNATVTQPASTISGTTVVTNVSCNSGTNGAINLTPAGGVAPYTFNWGGGVTTEDRTGLAAGSYAVTITDANGCTGTVTGITVTQPTLLAGNATVSNNVYCNGGSTGYIILFPSGGTMPYTYNWGGGITTKDRFGIPAGTYAVTITDNNGCTKVVSGITVTEPAIALSGTSSITNVSCNGDSNGSIIITPA